MCEVVKCKDCGFLGARGFALRDITEADKAFREDKDNGNPTDYRWVDKTRMYEHVPVCLVMRVQFSDEMRRKDGSERVRVLSENRDCDQFTKWQRGHSPQEHLEMMRSEQSLKDEQAWKERQEERQREWRLEDVREAERRHQEALKQAKRQHRTNLLVFGFLMTVISVVGELVANGRLPWFTIPK